MLSGQQPSGKKKFRQPHCSTLLPLPILLLPTPNAVISTGGGALAAAVESPPHFVFAVAFANLTSSTTVVS
jgi:hypothetical protein